MDAEDGPAEGGAAAAGLTVKTAVLVNHCLTFVFSLPTSLPFLAAFALCFRCLSLCFHLPTSLQRCLSVPSRWMSTSKSCTMSTSGRWRSWCTATPTWAPKMSPPPRYARQWLSTVLALPPPPLRQCLSLRSIDQHYYAKNIGDSPMTASTMKVKMKRLMKEIKGMRSADSLPCRPEASVFVRVRPPGKAAFLLRAQCPVFSKPAAFPGGSNRRPAPQFDESRPDVFKFILSGPSDTPVNKHPSNSRAFQRRKALFYNKKARLSFRSR